MIQDLNFQFTFSLFLPRLHLDPRHTYRLFSAMHPEHFRCDSVHSFDVGRWNCRRAMWIRHCIYMLLCRKLIISQHFYDIVQSLPRTCWLSMHFCVCTLRSAWLHMFLMLDKGYGEHAFSMVNNEMELLNLQTSFSPMEIRNFCVR